MDFKKLKHDAQFKKQYGSFAEGGIEQSKEVRELAAHILDLIGQWEELESAVDTEIILHPQVGPVELRPLLARILRAEQWQYLLQKKVDCLTAENARLTAALVECQEAFENGRDVGERSVGYGELEY